MNATVDPATDLAARWKPSELQIEAADVQLRAGEGEVITLHLLVNKDFGWWNEDVVVVPVPGVYRNRNLALAYLVILAKEHYMVTGKKVTGGYTWHQGVGEWAVFEDIMAVFPERV